MRRYIADLRPVLHTHSFDNLISTSFPAASFDLSPMPDTHSSLDN